VLGINTIGELAQTDAVLLHEHFGRTYAAWLSEVSRGLDDRPVVTSSEPKSISRETTFERDLHARHDRAKLSEIFTSLCTRLAEDLQRKAYVSRTIGIKLRYEDFRSVTRDLTLPAPTADAATIRRAAGECLRRVPLEKKLRLLGVRAGALTPAGEVEAADGTAQGELPLF
jgi:DNA polymerase-4